MRFDRQTFFNEYRKHFGSLNQDQVNGLTGLLNNYERYHGWWDNLDQIANSLSQVKHETAHSFQPCVEGYYLGDPHQPHYYQGNTQRVTRFQQHLRYYPHIGRGFLQLTWLENYKEIDRLTHKFFPELVTEYEQRTGQRFDLLAHPEQMFDADLSFATMTVGMHRGTFRAGHTLDRYINSSRVDHYYAREIVNGDKRYVLKGSGMTVGEAIAKEAKAFGHILRASLLETTPENVAEVIDSQRTDSPVATQLPPDSGQVNPLNDQQQPVENPSAGQPATPSPPIPTVEVTDRSTWFGTKLGGVVTGIFTGTYFLPKFDLSEGQIELFKLILPYIVIGLPLTLGIWYAVKKWHMIEKAKLLVTTNTNPAIGNMTWNESPPSQVASFMGAYLWTVALIFIIGIGLR